MRPSARQAFKERFGPEAGYQNLLRIYRKALKTTSVPATDVSLCQENQMPVLVFNLNEPGALRRAVEKEAVGTLVS